MRYLFLFSVCLLFGGMTEAQIVSEFAAIEIFGRTIPGTIVTVRRPMRRETIEKVNADGLFKITIPFPVNLSYGYLGAQTFNLIFNSPDSNSAKINITIPDQSDQSLESRTYILVDTIKPTLEPSGASRYIMYPEVKWNPEEKRFRFYSSTNISQHIKETRFIFEFVRFNTGSDELNRQGMDELDKLCTYLKELSGYELVIYGYTDDVGSDSMNLRLSKRRAIKVGDYLKLNGLKNEKIIINGYGSSNPLVPNTNSENRGKNRRVEVLIKPKG